MEYPQTIECDSDVETFGDGDPSAFAICSCGWSEVCPDEEVARTAAVIHQRGSDDAITRYGVRHGNDTA